MYSLALSLDSLVLNPCPLCCSEKRGCDFIRSHHRTLFHITTDGVSDEGTRIEPGVNDKAKNNRSDHSVYLEGKAATLIYWENSSATLSSKTLAWLLVYPPSCLLDQNCVAQPITYLKISESSLTVLHKYDFSCTLLLALVELGVLRKCSLFVL